MPAKLIEYHIIQSFPVSCLNRDDVGAPKTAIVGGVPRARVSSQSWKRQMRIELHALGVTTGHRTKQFAALLEDKLSSLGATEEAAKECAEKISKALVKDTLIFVSDNEVTALAEFAKDKAFASADLKAKDIAAAAKKAFNPAINGLDIALFGRMVANAKDMNVEAAAAVSHAISTHKTTNELEFFVAMDDLQADDDSGSAHMGSLEYNSATYYRYISLDVSALANVLEEDELKKAIDAFTKALFLAIPSARQNTQSAASPWDYAQVLVRSGQRVQASFEEPVRSKGEGYSKPSIEALKTFLIEKEAMFGSLFGKLGAYEWGLDTSYSIDKLSADLQSHI